MADDRNAPPIPDPDLLASSERYRTGWERLVELNGAPRARVVEQVAEVAPELARQIVAFGYGESYDTDALPARERQLLTIAALTALGGCEDQLEVHIGVALNVGVTPDELAAALTHVVPFAGFPRAINATGVLRRVLARRRGIPS